MQEHIESYVQSLESSGYTVETVEQRVASLSSYFTWFIRTHKPGKGHDALMHPVRRVRVSHMSSCEQCTTDDGARTQLVQHVSQLNVMLIALPAEEEIEEPDRIGFRLARDLETPADATKHTTSKA